MSDDPFAEPGDTESTMIRPRPGGQATGMVSGPRPVAAPAPPAATIPTVGLNPLIAAAAPLLSAAIRVAGGRGKNPDPDALRRSMVEGVRAFERQALATGLDTRSLRAARYALCATIDDLVLSTPWGSASHWGTQTLVSIFHNEVTGGERFFDILDQMQQDLGRHAEALELLYLCMALGFEGRYRVLPRGIAALTELRDSVWRTIRQRRGDFERDLSPHWKGQPAAHRPLSQRIPFWALGLGSLALVAVIYLLFNFALAGASDVAFTELSGLPPSGPIAVTHAASVAGAAPVQPPPPPLPSVVQTSASSKLHQFLAPEIKAGLVEVFEDPQSVTVRLAGRNMFASGDTILTSNYPPLLGRIGDALQDENGQVLVNGYTDNQPIRTVRFPSNFQLSQGRADAVAKLVAARLKDPGRVHAQGKADADPIAPNTTPEGRQANRRTEIVLVYPPAAS